MQKKILMFIPVFPVLSETFIEREVDGLVRSRKVDVVVVAFRKTVDFRSKRAKGVTVYERLSITEAFKSLRFVFQRPARVLRAFRVLGLGHLYPFLKSVGYSQVFSKQNPDYIYSHFLSEPSTIALGVSIILNVPVAISAHARDVLEYPDLVKEKVRHAKFITFCNRNALEKAKELAKGEDTSKLKLTYHGIDISDLGSPNKISVKKPGKNFIFSIARLEEKKGIEYLIGASQMLKERKVPHVIYVAGGGPLFETLDEEIRKLELQSNIVLLGSTPFEDVVQYLNLADYYVLPAINTESGDADGIPNTLIEAALSKLPIVTTTAGSISEFLTSDNALIVAQRHATGLADALETVINDRELGESLSKKAFDKALEMFNLENNISELEDLFLN